MATELVGKNRKSISMYCTALRITGWLLIVGLVALVVGEFVTQRMSSPVILNLLLPQWFTGYLFPGVFALGLAQLIRYIFENDYQPGWLLRHAYMILCVYSVVLLVSVIISYVYMIRTGPLPGWHGLAGIITLPVAKILILLGVGGILRQVMPIIEESKTLV